MTACPTGIAHTYMAADSLVAAGKKAGVTVHVETQGSSGSTPLDPSTIANADAVIFATDVGVKDKHRFAGKPVIASGVKRAINEPDKMVTEALAAATNPAPPRVQGGGERRHRVGTGRRRRLGYPHAADPAHRRELHDPVRRRGWPADRAGLPVRRLRDRPTSANDIALNNSLTNLPDGGFSMYLGAVLFSTRQAWPSRS